MAPLLLILFLTLLAGGCRTAKLGTPHVGKTASFAYVPTDGTVRIMDGTGSTSRQLMSERTTARTAAWSPTGRFIAYATKDGALKVIDVDTGVTRTVDDGTSGVVAFQLGSFQSKFVWSPDGRRLAFAKFKPHPGYADSGLGIPHDLIGIWIAAVDGGSRLIPESRGAALFAWSPDSGSLVFSRPPAPTASPDVDRDIYIVDADGADTARALTKGFWPMCDPWSPDGRLLAHWHGMRGGGGTTFSDAYILDLVTGRDIALGEFSSQDWGQWAPARGRYIFDHDVVDLDRESIHLIFGDGRPIAWSADAEKVAYVRSATGVLAILEVASSREHAVYQHSPSLPQVLLPGYYGTWSADGRYFAFVSVEGGDPTHSTLHVVDTTNWNVAPLLGDFAYGNDVYLSYSPDGSRLLIQTGLMFPVSDIWTANADGSDLARVARGMGLWNHCGFHPWRPRP